VAGLLPALVSGSDEVPGMDAAAQARGHGYVCVSSLLRTLLHHSGSHLR
jgi:hypothetical protein